jgi:Uma2 family endonuclease
LCGEVVRLTTRAGSTDDLFTVPENAKAEIVNGELVQMSPAGDAPNYAAGEIFASLREYSRRKQFGRAVTDNAAFKVDLPGRSSFSPDAAFYTGPKKGMRFFEGGPVFAAEVRSEFDYGPVAEQQLAQKRADYFAAGTLVVWDVDLLAADVVRVYRAAEPDRPSVYRRGDLAEAEPAVPGWKMPVDDLLL